MENLHAKLRRNVLAGEDGHFTSSRAHRGQVLMKLYYLEHDAGSAADQLFHSAKALFPLRGENVTWILLICVL